MAARCIDVFNGDADGLCALRRLRLARPLRTELVTGPKRDIALLHRVQAGAGDHVTVLDISLARNREPLQRLLAAGATVEYFDHHHAGEPPPHAGLRLHLDPSPGICTSLIVQRELGGGHAAWAVTGAFGDGLDRPARDLAAASGLDAAQAERLRTLGQALNYNAYGRSEADLLVPPADLYRLLGGYVDPVAFLEREPVVPHLVGRRQADLRVARQQPPAGQAPGVRWYQLPDAAWSRRVQGTFARELARLEPRLAHAVLVPGLGASWVVSVRAPLEQPSGADELCRRFPTGGGRSAAAGIDRLPAGRLRAFLQAFAAAFPAR